MMLEKAAAFVERTGDPVLTALAHFAVGQARRDETIGIISEYQRPDGGWTKTDKDFQAPLSTISTTWVALQWLRWLGARDTAYCQKTVGFLKTVQNPTGYWDEPEEILNYDPPPWMRPGRYENQLWLTSAVCCNLKLLGLTGEVAYDKALTFLAEGWDGIRFPEYTHTNWMGVNIFRLQNSERSAAIAEGCKAFLMKAIKEDRVDRGDHWAIAANSYKLGAFGADLFELAYSRAKAFQASDGGMTTEYGDKHRAGFTVEALFLAKDLGII